MSVVDRLTAITEGLGAVTLQAEATAKAVRSIETGASAAAAQIDSVSSRLSAAESGLADASARFLRSSASAGEALDNHAQRVAATAQSISSSASSLELEVSTAEGRITAATEKLQQETATRLDDLLLLVSQTKNAWDQDVAAMIDAVKLGVVPLQELVALYGDANVQGQRLIEFLDGLPLDTYTRRVQELINGLRDGAADLEKVKAFLAESNFQFAQNLLKTIELFKQGKVTLDAIADLVRKIKVALPDSQFADFAETLLGAIRRGEL